jgi:hypothetical protein
MSGATRDHETMLPPPCPARHKTRQPGEPAIRSMTRNEQSKQHWVMDDRTFGTDVIDDRPGPEASGAAERRREVRQKVREKLLAVGRFLPHTYVGPER